MENEVKQNEVKQVDTDPKATEKLGRVCMCMSGGLFFIGRMEGAGPKLYNPRIFNVFEEQERNENGDLLWLDKKNQPTLVETGIPKTKEMIGMRAFPGVPPFVYIPKDTLYYPVTTNIQNILNLYAQVTQPQSKIAQPASPRLVDAQGRALN
jgi:hypothetical protein